MMMKARILEKVVCQVKRSGRIFTLLLGLILVLSLAPFSASATKTATPFQDVSDTAWYAGVVQYVYDHNLMNGTSGNVFSPEEGTSRAMVVTILHRQAGTPEATAENTFKDVADGQWYTDAIRWAAEKGVVNGYSSETFGPNDLITRQQMATILYRYAIRIGADVSKSDDQIGRAHV